MCMFNNCNGLEVEEKIAAMIIGREHVEKEIRLLKKKKADLEKIIEELQRENHRLKKEIRILYVLLVLCIVLIGGLSKALYDKKHCLS